MHPALEASTARPGGKPGAASIAVEGLTKRFSTGSGLITALEDVSLTVGQGEFVAIVGPSGCGKSTMLKMLTGLLRPTAGRVRIDGSDVAGPRRDIGVVFQSPLLFPWRTVLENVMLPADIQKLDRPTHEARARELLALVGLSGFQDRYPNELSGGMQQRVSIARALLHQPAILLMDEPFGALDAMTREHMNVELLKLWNKHHKSILFITHSIPEAVFLADRVVVMTPRPGRVSEVLTIDLPRPRTLDIMSFPDFGAYVAHIRQHFGSIGVID